MNDKKKILIAGGDLRQIYCGKYFLKSSDKSERFDIYLAGFDDKYIPENMKKFSHNEIFDFIVFPVLPLKDDIYINTPFSKDKISVDEIKKCMNSNTVLFCGKPDKKFIDFFGENNICDYMEREELNILNAVPTAEGAVYIAIEEMPVTLKNSKVLITGFGRIGKALADILKGFGSDISIMTRSIESRAWAKVMNLKVCEKSDVDSSYNLIFNTAPAMIFDYEMLKKLGSDTILIDLASKPGGVDFKSAGELGVKAIWALGLPGKSAPITAGEIIAETIEGIIKERSNDEYD